MAKARLRRYLVGKLRDFVFTALHFVIGGAFRFRIRLHVDTVRLCEAIKLLRDADSTWLRVELRVSRGGKRRPFS